MWLQWLFNNADEVAGDIDMTQTSLQDVATEVPGRSASELLQIFSGAQDLPTLPQVAIRLLKLLNQGDSSAGDVARLIGQDPAISIKVLKMVNSALYASTSSVKEISDLKLAISRMGFVTVTNIALSTSVFGAFQQSEKPLFNRNEFWRHSVCVGVLATLLHDHLTPKLEKPLSRDIVHLAGIIHDIGKILFERYAHNEFHQAILNSQNPETDSNALERQWVGMSHDEAGAWLAQRWKLGKDIIAVTRYHHQPLCCPDEEHLDLVMLIHVADWMAHKLQLGESGQAEPELNREVQQRLNITPELINSMRDVIKKETAHSQVLLALNKA